MKKTLLFYTLLNASLLNASYYLELKDGRYFQTKKKNFPNDGGKCSFKSAPFLSAEWGYKHDSLRFGAQLGYLKQDSEIDKDGVTVFNAPGLKNQNFTTLSFMVNAYYDYKLKNNFSIYLGAGCGVTHAKYCFTEDGAAVSPHIGDKFSITKNVFAAQIMTGITYDINNNWALSLGYRCMKTESIKFKRKFIRDDFLPTLKTPFLHSVELGLRYSF